MEGTCALAVRVSQRSGRIVMVLGESEIRQKLKLWQTPQGLLGGYRFLLARPASGPLVSSGGRKILSVTEFATRAEALETNLPVELAEKIVASAVSAD